MKTRRSLRHVRYATVNKRVRALEELRYIKKIGVKKTKTGFEATIYDLSDRAYLAMLLNSIKLEDLITRVDEEVASSILGEVIKVWMCKTA